LNDVKGRFDFENSRDKGYAQPVPREELRESAGIGRRKALKKDA